MDGGSKNMIADVGLNLIRVRNVRSSISLLPAIRVKEATAVMDNNSSVLFRRGKCKRSFPASVNSTIHANLMSTLCTRVCSVSHFSSIFIHSTYYSIASNNYLFQVFRKFIYPQIYHKFITSLKFIQNIF